MDGTIIDDVRFVDPGSDQGISEHELMLARESAHIFSEIWRPVTVDTVIYKNYANPERIDNPIYIEHVEDMPAMQNNLMGCWIIADGQRLRALQTNDTAILPAYRGPGRLMKLYRSSYRDIEGVDLIFGLPNTQSYPTLKVMRWDQVIDYLDFSLPLSAVKILGQKAGIHLPDFLNSLAKRYLGHKLRRMSGSAYLVRRFESCPFSPEDLQVINQVQGIAIARSSEYFKWKIDNNKAGDFFYLTASRNGKLAGYLVVQTILVPYGTVNRVVDWWITRDLSGGLEKTALYTLLSELADLSDALQVPYVNSKGPEAILFREAGFRENTMSSPLMLLQISERSKSLDTTGEQWSFRAIDTDLILNA